MPRAAWLLSLALTAGCSSQSGNEVSPAGNEQQPANAAAPEPVNLSTSDANAEVSAPENAVSETAEPAPDLALKRGYYVAAGADCRQPASPDFRVWDGKGLSGSATRECVLSPVARDARGVKVEQTCVDTYSSKPSSTSFIVQLKGDSRFALIGEGGDQTYRLCPMDEVPNWLKDAKPIAGL